MNKTQGGKSILTSNATLLLYYACGMLSLVTGFSLIVAAVGAFMSRSVAYKEGVLLTVQHCTWILRSIMVTVLLLGVGGFTALHLVGESFLTLPDTTHIENFTQLWADPTLRLAVQYAMVIVFFGLCLFLWFIYRMVRGACMLMQASPPVRY